MVINSFTDMNKYRTDFHNMTDEINRSNGTIHRRHRISPSINPDITEEQNTVAQPTDENHISLIPTQKRRQIMISYDPSSINICRKIYDHLIERHYKVWIDFDHTNDDTIGTIRQAIDDSYIVILCIDQNYSENDYCRLVAEYTLKKRIKYIPCLMEKAFKPESWLGIIKGSNFHVDFSSADDFDQSFEQLIRQINVIEQILSVRRRKSVRFNRTEDHESRSNLNIDEYKQIIEATNQILLEEEEENETELLKKIIYRTLEQNELLLEIITRLINQQSIQTNTTHRLNMNRIIKTVLTMVFFWLLIIYCQKL